MHALTVMPLEAVMEGSENFRPNYRIQLWQQYTACGGNGRKHGKNNQGNIN